MWWVSMLLDSTPSRPIAQYRRQQSMTNEIPYYTIRLSDLVLYLMQFHFSCSVVCDTVQWGAMKCYSITCLPIKSHHTTSHLISSYPRLYYSTSCIWHCSTLSYCILLLSTCNIIHGKCHRVRHFTLCLKSRSRVCNCFDDRCEVVRTKRNDLQSSHFFALLFLRCGPGVAITDSRPRFQTQSKVTNAMAFPMNDIASRK